MALTSVEDWSRTRWPAVEAWYKPGHFAVILTLAVMAAFPDVLFGGRTFIARDFGLFGYPLAHYYRESFWRGEIPLWNPLSNCGLPFLAQWNTMVLYPPSLFYLICPLQWALGVFCIAHLYLAGLGMYFLARHWTGNQFAATVAGIAFAFNGLTLNCLMWPNNIAALGWMPWVVLSVLKAWSEDGRQVIIAALAGTMQLLAGAPEILLFTWGLLSAIWLIELWQKNSSRWLLLSRLFLVVVLVNSLSAAQLLPFFELYRHSHRGAEYAVGIWSMPIWGWANLVVPSFHCIQTDDGGFYQADQYWISSYYPGVGIVALALLAAQRWRKQRVWLLGTLLILSLVLALGDRGYLYYWLRAILPLGAMRFAIKFIVLAIFLLPVLAACAVAERRRTEHSSRTFPWTMGVWLGLLGLIAFLVWLANKSPLQFENSAATLRSGLARALVLTLVLGAVALLGRAKQVKHQLLIGVGLLLLLWADVMTHAPRLNPTVDNSVYAPGLPDFQQLNPKPTSGQSRALLSREALSKFYATGFSNSVATYYGQRLGLFANCNLLDGLPKVDGFFSLYLREQRELHFQIYDENKQLRPHLADFLSACQVTSRTNVIAWEPRLTFLPMITAGHKPVFRARDITLAEMLTREFDPAHVVYLPLEAQAEITATNQAKTKTTGGEFTAHQNRFALEASESTVVVVSQAFFPAWKAYVDGKPAHLWRANHAFQALEVPAGRHEVKLAYEDRHFYGGTIISAFTLVGCGVSWIRLGNRRGPN